MAIGNSFLNKKITVGGKADRVWREIRHRYPAGGMITNVSDFASDGKIRSGQPVAYNLAAKTITVLTDAQVKAASTAEAIAALGINGYLQEDVVINVDGSGVPEGFKASGTVVYAGELYDYMFDAQVLAVLKKVAVPGIVFVN